MEQIIPLVLCEDDIDLLSDEILAAYAECATSQVRFKIDAYLENPNADKRIRDRVYQAFSADIEQREFLSSQRTQDCVTLLSNLSYLDITAYTDDKLLQSYADAITYVLDNELSVPYIEPKDKADYEHLIALLNKAACDYRLANDIEKFARVNTITDHTEKLKHLFYEPKYTPYKGTPVKKILRNRQKYKIILRGVNFLLDKHKAGALPASWRYL